MDAGLIVLVLFLVAAGVAVYLSSRKKPSQPGGALPADPPLTKADFDLKNRR